MKKNQNIINFPNPIETKKFRYAKIRDEIEKILFNYALDYLNGRLVTCAHLRYGSYLIHKRAFIHSKPEFLGNSLIF